MTHHPLLDFSDPPPPPLALAEAGEIIDAFRRDSDSAPPWYYFAPDVCDKRGRYTPVRIALPRGWTVGEAVLHAGQRPQKCLLDSDGVGHSLTGAAMHGRVRVLTDSDLSEDMK